MSPTPEASAAAMLAPLLMPADILLESTTAGVTTLTMNNPRKLNGWTADMMEAMLAALERAAHDEDTRALILTGTDPYYCAGVNLGGTLRMGHPKQLHGMIVERNEGLFNTFLRFPKPIIIAVNGPVIGAAVTSATLCDAIIASHEATFSTPFAALSVPPEGCSSVLFARLMGEENAARILGEEGWKPSATEAERIGLIDRAVPHDQLLAEAQKLAEQWIAEGRGRIYKGDMEREQLERINARESRQIADAFLGPDFIRGQFRFLWKKKKYQPAMMFLTLLVTRPLWSLML